MIEVDGGGFDPFVLALDRFRQKLDDVEPVWELAIKWLMIEHAGAFHAQKQAGTSDKWAPLSDKYRAYKDRVRPGRKILVFDGDLRDSLTKADRGVRVVEPGFMVFGSDIDYAKYHMTGTPNMPARPPLIDAKRSKSFKRYLAVILQEHIVKGK